MALRWIKTALGVNVIHKGDSKLVPVDHQHYEAILTGLKAGDESVLNLIDELKRKINDFSGVDFSITGGELLFRGKRYHDEILTEKILAMIERGYNAAPLVRFLEKVEQNPNPESVRMLWDFLQNAGLAIADDGDILGFKYVDLVANIPFGPKKDKLVAEGAIYTDRHSNSFNMNPGQICEMPRHHVVISDGVCAGAGLHVGTYQYAQSAEHSVMVKVNPADVVSVPSAEAHKMRVCRYTVLQRFDDKDIDDNGLKEPVYKVDGTKMTTSDFIQSRTVQGSGPGPEGFCDNESASHWDNQPQIRIAVPAQTLAAFGAAVGAAVTALGSIAPLPPRVDEDDDEDDSWIDDEDDDEDEEEYDDGWEEDEEDDDDDDDCDFDEEEYDDEL